MTLEELTKLQEWNDAETLGRFLMKCSDAYYSGENSPLSDAAFDRAVARLRELDSNHPFLCSVGAQTGKAKHHIPMGSLSNVNNEDEFRAWWGKTQPGEVVVQYKYDGLSIGLEYANGALIRAITRGDGVTGELCTNNMRRCASSGINKLKKEFTGSVRGEAIIFKEDFNEENFPGESNPRNSAVGAVRKENSSKIRFVRMICYDLLNGIKFKTEVEKLQYMADLGLPTAEYKVCKTPEEVIDYYNEVVQNRDNIPFMIDGLVVKINDTQHQQRLGEHHMRPKWARAFKFPNMTGISTIRKILLTVGHTGQIIPDAEYDPITIEGRTFKHALLDNFDTIERMGIGIGAKVEIYIAGDIIPKVLRVIEPPKEAYPRPQNCPVCGAPTIVDGAYTRCTGDDCSAKTIGKINHWIKKTDIKYLGGSRQEALFEAGVLKDIPDLYTMTFDEVAEVVGRGNAKMIMDEIDAHRELPLNVFMGALGIKYLGVNNAKRLMDFGVDTLDKFFGLTGSERFHGFGDTIITIVAGIEANKERIKKLIAAGVKIKQKEEPKQNDNTLSFCFTGVRLKKLKSQFEAKGWVEKSSVGSGLDYLVAKDPNANSTKLRKARDKGIKIISMDEFKEMLAS